LIRSGIDVVLNLRALTATLVQREPAAGSLSKYSGKARRSEGTSAPHGIEISSVLK